MMRVQAVHPGRAQSVTADAPLELALASGPLGTSRCCLLHINTQDIPQHSYQTQSMGTDITLGKLVHCNRASRTVPEKR